MAVMAVMAVVVVAVAVFCGHTRDEGVLRSLARPDAAVAIRWRVDAQRVQRHVLRRLCSRAIIVLQVDGDRSFGAIAVNPRRQ